VHLDRRGHDRVVASALDAAAAGFLRAWLRKQWRWRALHVRDGDARIARTDSSDREDEIPLGELPRAVDRTSSGIRRKAPPVVRVFGH
jgi:hypothetical protein